MTCYTLSCVKTSVHEKIVLRFCTDNREHIMAQRILRYALKSLKIVLNPNILRTCISPGPALKFVAVVKN